MDVVLRAPRPPLGFSPNGSSSALPPPMMPNATLASAGPLGGPLGSLGPLAPLMTRLLADAEPLVGGAIPDADSPSRLPSSSALDAALAAADADDLTYA